MDKKKVITFLLLLLLLLPSFYLSGPKVNVTLSLGENWLSGWQYRKEHVIQGSIAGAQTDYQIKIIVHKGTGTDLGEHVYCNNHCRDDFGDIRFTDSDGETLLDYWMEEYTSGNKAIFWVEVPSIPASPNTATIYIYYGNPTATTTSAVLPTFIDDISGLKVAYPLDETSGNTAHDRSGNGNDGTINNPDGQWTDGKFYGAYQGESGSRRIDTPYIPPQYGLTVLGWFLWDGTNNRHMFGTLTNTDGFSCKAYSNALRINVRGCGVANFGSIYPNIWTHVALVIKSNEFRVYQDGTDVGGISGTPVGSSQALRVAALPKYLTAFNWQGKIDEFLVFETVLTQTQIQEIYSNLGYATPNYPGHLLIRKYVDPEPSHGAWGSEEEYSLLEVVTYPAQVNGTEVLLTGEIINIGDGEVVDERGFEWGTEPGVYTEEWTETGTFGTGVFTHTTSFLPGTYYYRAKAHNSYGWGYGQEKSFVVTYWLSGWQYRKSLEIVGSTAGAVTNYQIRIKVHRMIGTDSGEDIYVGTKCRADFGDVRFTKSDGVTLLDYWLEEHDGNVATFWVEVPSIPASPDKAIIYIYYGNPSVTTTSDGEATFIDFDDFEYTGSIEYHGWTIDKSPSAGSLQTVTSLSRIGSRSLKFVDSDTAGGWVIYRTFSAQTRCMVHIFARAEQRSANLAFVWKDFLGGINFAYINLASTGYIIYKNRAGSSVNIQSYSANTWYRIEAVLNTNTDKYEKILIDGVEKVTNKDSWNPASCIGCFTIWSAGNSQTGTTYIDGYYVRKYVDPEPSHGAWGSEEEAPFNQAPAPPTLDCPVVNAHFDPSASVTFSWIFNDPDAGDSQSAYQFQLDDNSDFSSPIIDTGKVSSSTSSTTQTLPSMVGLYYWRVKTWDSQDAEGEWSEARPIIVDRIKIIGGVVVDFTIDVDVGGKIWYYAVYEYDNSTFNDSCGVLYVNGFEMIWTGKKWIYAFPYSTEGNQITFHITGVLDNQYGLTEINNPVGDIIINWATITIEIKK